MEWNGIKTNWRTHFQSAQERWDMLKEDDLLMINGDRDKLIVFLQDLYGIGRDRAETEVEDWVLGLPDNATLVTANSVSQVPKPTT
jgi:uncharacterized protein YjbJ (UPF0337 family)